MSLSVLREVFQGATDDVLLTALSLHGQNAAAAADYLFAHPEHLDAPAALTPAPAPAAVRRGGPGAGKRPVQHQHKWGDLQGRGAHVVEKAPASGPRFSQAAPAAASCLPHAADFPSLFPSAATGVGAAAPPASASAGYATAAGRRNHQEQYAHQYPLQQQPNHQPQPLTGSHQERSSVALFLEQCYPWAGRDIVQAVLQSTAFDACDAEAVLADMASYDEDGTPLQPGVGSDVDGELSGAPSGVERGGSYAERERRREDVYRNHRRDAVVATRAWLKTARRAAAAFGNGDRSTAASLSTLAARLRGVALGEHERAAERIEADINDSNSLWELDVHGLHAKEALAAVQRRLELLALPPQQQQQHHHYLQPHSRPQQQRHHHSAPRPQSRQPRERSRRDDSYGQEQGDSGRGDFSALLTRASAGAPAATAAAIAATAAALTASSTGGSREGGSPFPVGAQASALRGAHDAPLAPPPPPPQCSRLQIIVGKGNHSAGGEASLPRVVSQHLELAGYRYVMRGGSIEVRLDY